VEYMNLDKIFESASREISERSQAYETTDMKKVIVKKGGEIAEFAFTDNFDNIPDEKSLKKLAAKISKRFGDIETGKVITQLKRIKKSGYADNKVDLEIVDGNVKLVEANIEIKDKNASNITVNGKPFNGSLGDLKAKFPKHFAALKAQLKKDGKSIANFGGNSPAVDIVAQTDGTVKVTYDA